MHYFAGYPARYPVSGKIIGWISGQIGIQYNPIPDSSDFGKMYGGHLTFKKIYTPGPDLGETVRQQVYPAVQTT